MKNFSGKIARAFLLAFAASVLACDGGSGFGPKVKVGDRVPRSDNRIALDENQWQEVSSADTKMRLYRWKIADLVEKGKPFLVVFGTPQHCSMCVDQLTRVAAMEEKYGERFAFIHVDGYKDSAVWIQWGVKGEPWTFLVDAKGVARKVFPGQTELPLLEENIEKLLRETS
jgi:hypothetical protein